MPIPPQLYGGSKQSEHKKRKKGNLIVLNYIRLKSAGMRQAHPLTNAHGFGCVPYTLFQVRQTREASRGMCPASFRQLHGPAETFA
jgi:hypothetical protein